MELGIYTEQDLNHLAPNQPQYQGHYDANKDHRGDREIKAKILSFDNEIAGQVAQANFLDDWPDDADDE